MIVIVVIFAFSLVLALSLMKVSSQCSRQEEREEMRRWEEMNKNIESQRTDK